MLQIIKKDLEILIKESVKDSFSESDIPQVNLETPLEKIHGEFSLNLPLKSAKFLKKSPMIIADEFVKKINDSIRLTHLSSMVTKIEAKAPGFINFYLTPKTLTTILDEVYECKDDYGKTGFGKGQKVLMEFVSANPTGPLSVAHARQAVVGDVLVNILRTLGFDASKEFYVNDGGNQIRILGESFRLRALEILGEKIDFPEECYQGEYIKDMSKLMLEELKKLSRDDNFDANSLNDYDKPTFQQFAVSHIMDVIKKELSDFRVDFDIWSYESAVANKEKVKETLDILNKKGFVYEKDGALWFKSTDFGDDKDRVVRKSDGSYTYLAPDIVYHKNKFERGFKTLYNIWGPDHHGYIPRIKAAAKALGHSQEDIKVLIVQLATVFRNGQAVSMSTRRGQYISLREVMEEVGVDAARFFFLMRHISAHLEFDLELAKKQSPENPVYYIQYAYARIYSINKKANEAGLKIKESGFLLLDKEEELDLIKKIGSFNDSLMFCYNQVDPFALVVYLQELATCFHRFYDTHKVICEDKELSSERLGLINAARIVLGNGLKLLGLSRPKQM